MLARHLSLLAAVTLLAPSVASSQGTGQARGTLGLEIGGFGSFTHFDQQRQFDDNQGYGARAGLIVGSGWSRFQLEAEGSLTKAWFGTTKLESMPTRASLLYHIPVERERAVILGAGALRHYYTDKVADTRVHENGASAIVGVRTPLATYATLRIDYVLDYSPASWNKDLGTPDSFNSNVEVGLSVPLWLRRKPLPVTVAVAPTPAPAPAPAPAVVSAADADGDGVADTSDQCAATPFGTSVDSVGCPVYRDTDSDGVVDPRDRCPATTLGTVVDGTGCPLPTDADGDGVTDDRDACPGTAAGTTVDVRGCVPLTDADNDGVVNSKDRCPGTPAGTEVDGVGCPLLFKNPTERTVTLRGVNFAPARATLTPASLAVLDEVARQLIEASTIRIEIAGHTDNRGTSARNNALSRARAATVRAYLIGQGVAADRMISRGYGAYAPIESNATPSGRAMNRRVELRRLN
jgi:outer membrane protein OmpA-like peptidoglycan-associated protein